MTTLLQSIRLRLLKILLVDRSSERFDSAHSADLEGLTTEVTVDMVAAASASCGLMEVDVDLNKGIQDEDLRVDVLGEPHDVSPINDHPLCVNVSHGRIVVPTLKGGDPYASFCTKFCLRAES
jgi:hypothetical protein